MAKSRAKTVKTVLGDVGKKLSKSERLRAGTIAFRLSGAGGGNFCVTCAPGSTKVTEGAAAGPHTIEVMGPASQIQAILEGEKDARKQFLAGGIRIRGDIRYLSDLAIELGIIDEPI